MKKSKLCIVTLVLGGVWSALCCSLAEAQIFDQLKRQFEGELRRGIQKAIPIPSQTPPPMRGQPGPGNPPPVQGQRSIPSESGGKNDRRFEDFDSFFRGNQGSGQPNPRPVQPNPGFGQPNPTPGYGQPNPTPGYGTPSQSYYYDQYGNRIYGRPPGTVVNPRVQPRVQPVEPPKYSNLEIVLKCPRDTPTISYQLISGSGGVYSYNMQGGESQKFKESTLWQVQYVSGGVQKKYRLRGGKSYIFVQDDQGRVQLYQTEEKKKPVEEPPMFLGN